MAVDLHRTARGTDDQNAVPLGGQFRGAAGAGLAADAFSWAFIDENDDRFDFAGTYVLNGKGKPQLTLDPVALQAEVQEVFDAILARDPTGLPSGVTLRFEIKSAKSKFRAKTKRDGSRRAKSTLLLKFRAIASGAGQKIAIHVTLKHAAKGGPAE